MKKGVVFLLLTILSLILDVVAELLDIFWLKAIFQPATMLFLTLYYVLSTKLVNRLLTIGLISMFLGEIVFLGGDDVYFVYGILFDVIAHILYTFAIWKMIRQHNFNLLQILLSFILFFSFLGVFLVLTYSQLGEFRLPVIFYGMTLCIMGAVTTLYYLCKVNIPSLIMLGGITVLVLSALAVGFDKFYIRYQYFEVFNIITFALSQFLICYAMILVSKKSY